MGALLDKPITEKKSKSGFNRVDTKLRYAVSTMQGWLTEMEDEHLVVTSLPVLPNLAFFGIFDGHNGNFTARFVRDNFKATLESRPEFQYYIDLPCQSLRDHRVGMEILKAAVQKTFLELDREMKVNKLRKTSKSKISKEEANKMLVQGFPEIEIDNEDKSGSTCLVVIVTPKHMLCVNLGDSRACVSIGGLTLALSHDHKPHYKSEQSRIEAAGGYVGMKRVDGDLTVSRALGSYQYKDNPNLPPEAQKVSSVPDIIIRQRSNLDEYIVLASDGVWDVLSCSECTSLISQIVSEGEHNLSLVCEEVLDQCLEKESKDNMSIIIVAFPNMRFTEKPGPGVNGRRLERQQQLENVRKYRRSKDATKARLKGEAEMIKKKLELRLRREEERDRTEHPMIRYQSTRGIKGVPSFTPFNSNSSMTKNVAPWA